MLVNLLKNKYIIALLLIVVAYAVGYYYSPDKVKIQYKEKIVYKTKTMKEENKKITEKYDSKTGKIIEKTTETGTKETAINTIQQNKDKTITKEKTQKNYALKLGERFSISYKDLKIKPDTTVIGGEIRIPKIAFTPSWIGVDIDSNADAGLYLRWEF